MNHRGKNQIDSCEICFLCFIETSTVEKTGPSSRELPLFCWRAEALESVDIVPKAKPYGTVNIAQ
jgi:hypothetical protein